MYPISAAKVLHMIWFHIVYAYIIDKKFYFFFFFKPCNSLTYYSQIFYIAFEPWWCFHLCFAYSRMALPALVTSLVIMEAEKKSCLTYNVLDILPDQMQM